jgi:nucleoside-diphosphate-sugar epimerase
VPTPPVVVVCLGGLFCLAPLAVYLLWLGLVTRRDRPTVLSGPLDFAALAAGLSGFVLFGGGLVLTLLQSNFRYLMRGNFESLRKAWGDEQNTWILLSALYLLAVVGAVALTLAARRRSLVVYNVDPDEFEATVGEVFDRLGRPVERKGRAWVGGGPLFELDRFDGGRTVTLRWVSKDAALFAEAERLIREAVGNTPADDNPATRWLMSAAGGAGFSAGCFFGLILVYVFSR